MRTRVLFYLLIIAGVCHWSMGQESEPTKGRISPSEILQKNLIATGGLEAHKALETLVASGEIHVNGKRIGEYKFSYKAPRKNMLEIRMFGGGATWIGGSEKGSVDRSTSDLLAVPPPHDSCRSCVIDGVHNWTVASDWLVLLRWDFCSACNIELIGMGEVDKRLAYALRFTSKNGGNSFVCFYDRETFLLVRIDRIDRFQKGPNRVETMHKVESIFRDYREQGGVKLPLSIAIPRPEGELVFEVSKIKTGEPIKDSVFE